MATDKASMKLRIQAIGKIVMNLPTKRCETPWEAGFEAGQRSLGEQIRRVLHSPVKGLAPSTPELEARTMFLLNEERLAKEAWRTMDPETKSAWLQMQRAEAERLDKA